METHHPSSAGPPIATQLFTKQLSRPPIRRGCGGGDPPSVLALLCGIAVVSIGLLSLPLSQNDEVGVLPKLKRFMDSDLLLLFDSAQDLDNYEHFKAGALPLAILAGVVVGLSTFLIMFYDSAHPGKFPLSPVTPRKFYSELPSSPLPKQLPLGYRMVVGNALLFSILFLVCFRVYFKFPFI